MRHALLVMPAFPRSSNATVDLPFGMQCLLRFIDPSPRGLGDGLAPSSSPKGRAPETVPEPEPSPEMDVRRDRVKVESKGGVAARDQDGRMVAGKTRLSNDCQQRQQEFIRACVVVQGLQVAWRFYDYDPSRACSLLFWLVRDPGGG